MAQKYKINLHVYLNDGEIAVIERGKELKVYDAKSTESSKIEITELQMSIEQLEKGGYPHFMLKEIFEQPRTLADCISGRISAAYSLRRFLPK